MSRRRVGVCLGGIVAVLCAGSAVSCGDHSGSAIATKSRRVAAPTKPKGKGKGKKGPATVDRRPPVQSVNDELSKLTCPPKGVKPVKGEFTLPPPPFSEGIFPCDECHADMEAKPRRKLTEAHTEIKLEHGTRQRWCYDCHNPKPRNKLRLAGGSLVDFKKSYELCGQCHGPKLRDWRKGLHGKRYGQWRGKKCNLLCAHCHNPHSPRFKGIRPLPPPVRPIHIR